MIAIELPAENSRSLYGSAPASAVVPCHAQPRGPRLQLPILHPRQLPIDRLHLLLLREASGLGGGGRGRGHGGGAGDGLGVDIQVWRLARRPDVLAARGVELSTSRVRPRR